MHIYTKLLTVEVCIKQSESCDHSKDQSEVPHHAAKFQDPLARVRTLIPFITPGDRKTQIL